MAASKGSRQELQIIIHKILLQVKDGMKIRQKQLEAVYNIVCGRDTLCLLPTSSGKSLIYQLLPALWKVLPSKKNVSHPTVVVISPLLALMDDQILQVNAMTGLGVSAVRIQGCVEVEQILSGSFNLIFGSPEAWINDKKWNDVLSSKIFHQNVVCLVVDEVHKVTW